MRYQNDTVYYTTDLEMFKPMEHNRVKSKGSNQRDCTIYGRRRTIESSNHC